MVEENDVLLKQFIESNADDLKRILGHYALRAGVATVDTAQAVASEILSDVVVEALNHADRLRTPDNPLPWLLGIGLNLIKRRRRQYAQLHSREPLLHDLYSVDELNEVELIDRFIGAASTDNNRLEANEGLQTILSRLSATDERLLRLAILHDLDSQTVAERMGITAGAARVRLHRILKRLRQFWGTRERLENHE